MKAAKNGFTFGNMRSYWLPALVLVAGFSLSFVLRRDGGDDPALDARNVNLALRQLGHELLEDSLRRAIPPVENPKAGEYLLPTATAIRYDSLLKIGPEVLSRFGIRSGYSLAIKDCRTNKLLLGFDARGLDQDGTPACTGRDQEMGGCYNLSLRILPTGESQHSLFWITLGIMLVTLTLGWPRRAKPVAPVDSDLLRLGKGTTYDPTKNLLANSAGERELTHREAKLLCYFASHPNRPLARADIQAAVWGSDGLMNGRSLDVFVSRLRKYLAADPTVKIVTCHGVGYRFSVG